ncbi:MULTISPECIES: diadenylate cyclase CdaA [Butyrivibrio]|uniref:Diadenylate cyclase n=2 Tax=Butyrivibrio fibrisolvens TaxID=831 RepID=A0A1H9NVH1_BUTFI|nr:MULTISPECIES: diadenylate cyclase CdaA [Butyrivibrio]MBQ1457394.1 diadenylate cyclase CdaA [Butyrivibrio sp.]MCR4636623.1 diadenylate cyclase CdaA [Butyrivibrio sp.]PWT26911.1 TIGR00159 family protein [Butyrivibrio fibrisolvens]SEP57979.1 diadenylate cyclase [Butyrivibrio sp. TB]SER39675.1 diadenylate cyclase [Butyrivibrio fibrisolvens]
MDTLQSLLDTNFTNFHMPDIRGTDIVEILIIAFLVYHMLVWMRNTRIWSLMKGIVVIVIFIIIAALFNMNTILWIVQNVLSIAVIAVVVVLQPELRRALEQLGRKNFLSGIFPFDISGGEGRFSDRTIDEIARACVEMAKVRTGALIVIEQEHSLAEYEQTGIEVDAIVTSQLLINIFEHNTPLHDGAVIVRGNRITAATCYLPLSDNMNIGKELGTRHRAGVGVSEVTDSLTIIVSEETGKISVAYGGVLDRSLDSEKLKDRLRKIQNKTEEEHKHRPVFRGRAKAE